MNFRRENEQEAGDTREEVRELAEAIGLYRSAMRHVAEREVSRPWVVPARRPARTMRTGLMLVPVLAAALVVAIMAPWIGHRHPAQAAPAAETVALNAQQENTQQQEMRTHAGVDDTVLMNQIDSEVSAEVPDALEPLAELSEQATTTTLNSNLEKKHVSQN